MSDRLVNFKLRINYKSRGNAASNPKIHAKTWKTKEKLHRDKAERGKLALQNGNEHRGEAALRKHLQEHDRKAALSS